MNGETVQERAAAAERAVHNLLLRDGQPVVVVDSPPGAGKTRLVEAITGVAAISCGLRVAVATARAEQSYELIRRLMVDFPTLRVQPLTPEDRPIPRDLQTDPRLVTSSNRPANLASGALAVVATAAKLETSLPFFGQLPAFDVMITDEAYQLQFKQLANLQAVATQMLLVGDPGQLPPFSRIETSRFDAAFSKVHWPGPKEILRIYGSDIPVVQLPASWRFTQDTVELLQPGFYPTLPFESALSSAQRQLTLVAAGMGDGIDRALDALSNGASIVVVIAPPKLLAPEQIDEELAQLQAQIVQRAITRGATWEGVRRLTERDIGCADAHVASGAALRRELLGMNISVDPSTGVLVETPEIWQGLQRPLMVVKHPLSGLRRIDEFALEPGRACVMLSRHQLGCLVVTRAGIADALDDYQHDSGARPTGSEDMIWAGREAHWALWNELERRSRIFSVN